MTRKRRNGSQASAGRMEYIVRIAVQPMSSQARSTRQRRIVAGRRNAASASASNPKPSWKDRISDFRHGRLPHTLLTTSLKSVSSMKLHREFNITQKSAWHLAHRIRKSFESEESQFSGFVEVDENYIGGTAGNKHEDKKLKAGRGAVGKTAVVGAKNRKANKISAKVINDTKRKTLHEFIQDNVEKGSIVCTDDFKSYLKMKGYEHKTVKHSTGEYVDKMAHINGMESF